MLFPHKKGDIRRRIKDILTLIIRFSHASTRSTVNSAYMLFSKDLLPIWRPFVNKQLVMLLFSARMWGQTGTMSSQVFKQVQEIGLYPLQHLAQIR